MIIVSVCIKQREQNTKGCDTIYIYMYIYTADSLSECLSNQYVRTWLVICMNTQWSSGDRDIIVALIQMVCNDDDDQ